MKKLIFILSMIVSMLSACNGVDTPQPPVSGETDSVTKTRSEENGNILTFASEHDFEVALANIASLESTEDKLMSVKEKFPNFISIQEIYGNALAEAENLEEDEASYLNFKERYSSLYFPMIAEDAGFYIPMSNLNTAFLMNEKCEVRIGNTIKSMKDIVDYSQLVELGRAYYSNPLNTTADSYTEFNFDGPKSNIPPTYEAGWRYNNDRDRMINLKMDRQVVKYLELPTYTVCESRLHIEISFRKKTWLGWVNYSSNTNIAGKFEYPNSVWAYELDKSNSGNSSHDIWFTIPIEVQPTSGASDLQGAYRAIFPKITATNLKIIYRGFADPISYNVSIGGATCIMRVAGAIIPSL